MFYTVTVNGTKWMFPVSLEDIGGASLFSKKPFDFEDVVADKSAHNYRITTVDAAVRAASTKDLEVATA